MDDRQIIATIDALVDEEHGLERRHGAGEPLTADDRARMADIEVQLDQAWDLLRQRRARRNAGVDPDGASTRGGETVEHYQQ